MVLSVFDLVPAGYEIGGDAEDLRNKYRSPECNAMMDQTIEAGLLNPATAAIGSSANDPMVRNLLQMAGAGNTGNTGANAASCAAAIKAATSKQLPAARDEKGKPRNAARQRVDLAGLVSGSDFFPLSAEVYLMGEEILAQRRRADEERAKQEAEQLALAEQIEYWEEKARQEVELAEKPDSAADESQPDAETSLNNPWGSHASEEDWEELEELLSSLSDSQVERLMMQALHKTELLEDP
eukprot:COSAG02_NODE_2489_length_8698_cov_6.406443_9_plen_240_part_00